MTARPHCLKCGSASVIRDDDVLNGRVSIYCAMCGNRQYNGTDYVGFEMREGNMGIRATCKNCRRPGMSIIREELCGTCAAASKENPDPVDRAAALAFVRVRIERGELKGPRHDGPRKAKAAKDPGGPRARYRTQPKEKLDSLRNGIRTRLDVGAAYPKPEEKLGPGGDLKQYEDAELIRQKTVIMSAALKTPITLHLRFADEDILLYSAFHDYCRRNRRSPEEQILFLIDDIVKANKALAVAFGAQP